ncbi:uncharacterized protein LOC132637561 [Lycium barbarum]|uniref:uncharacterized protein LOC132637561 n=1 Tax=Lycium barbarum TaxID=112863 RepID=UPI00293F1C8F|nr:uncharacterized protein LOC132637561 [Lycium barbarum]
MGQITGPQNTRLPRALPSDTDMNPKLCNAVTLWNGRELEKVAPKKTSLVHVNVPLVDMLQGIPNYAKYIKDIVANKSRFTEYATIALIEECTSRIQNRLPKNLKDPESFTIDISIGKHIVARALCDPGASTNLMPSSIFRKLGLGVPKPTTIVLQRVNRSLARPKGIIEDVLVQVGFLIIPTDFVILDFEPNSEVPFILGRLFLAPERALIDIAAGQLNMRVHDKVDVLNVYKALKMPAVYEELSAITILNDDTRRPLITCCDPLERSLLGDDIFGDTEMFEMVQTLDMVSIYIREGEFEPLDLKIGVTLKLSIEEPLKLELKPLPAHLKYSFLGEGDTLPVILAVELTDEEVSVCMEVLKSHKWVLGWQISDIQGISPALCMHKMLMKDSHKTSAQYQKRLNPVMKRLSRKR